MKDIQEFKPAVLPKPSNQIVDSRHFHPPFRSSCMDLLVYSCISSLSHCHLSHSPHSSVCRYFPVQSVCSPAPGRELPGCSLPPGVSLRFPPANWRHGERIRMYLKRSRRQQSGKCKAEHTWQCRRSSCSLLPFGTFCPWLSTVERRSWASARRA